MKSIYERALGDAFDDLHPKMQKRFGFASEDGVAAIGRGTMDYVRKAASTPSPSSPSGRG